MDNIREKNNKERTNKREFVKKSPYEEKVISIGRVSKTTKGGRTMRFTATVAVGDRKGKVGLGTGKASEVPTAISKAIKAAEKNVISINLVEGRTLSHEAIGKCGAAKVLVKPAKAGTGIIAGGPVRNVLELAGVKDIVSKSLVTLFLLFTQYYCFFGKIKYYLIRWNIAKSHIYIASNIK